MDKRLWLPDKENGFSVTSFLHSLNEGNLIGFPAGFIWDKAIPSKILFLTWKIWWDRIPMLDNLICRGMVSSNYCYMCSNAGESAMHLLVHCKVRAGIWDFFLGCFQIQWVSPASLRIFLACWMHQPLEKINGIVKLCWKLIPAAVCWTIWMERNQRVFNGVSSSHFQLVNSVLSLIYDWISMDPTCSPGPFSSWVFEWDSLISSC